MNRRQLVGRSLKALPAIVLAAAALLQIHSSRERVRANPAPDTVMMLASRGPAMRAPRAGEPRSGLSPRELAAIRAAKRGVR